MNTDVCFHEIQYKFSQSFIDLIGDFFIDKDSVQQVFELLNVNDFLHAIPVFIIMFGLVMFIKENDKFEFSWLLKDFQSNLRISIKVCKITNMLFVIYIGYILTICICALE